MRNCVSCCCYLGVSNFVLDLMLEEKTWTTYFDYHTFRRAHIVSTTTKLLKIMIPSKDRKEFLRRCPFFFRQNGYINPPPRRCDFIDTSIELKRRVDQAPTTRRSGSIDASLEPHPCNVRAHVYTHARIFIRNYWCPLKLLIHKKIKVGILARIPTF